MSGVATQPGTGSPSEPLGTPAGSAAPPVAATREGCPLCGAPLQAEQEWCLRCGAAARTRLAATPGWRAPIAAIVAVIALSLGVLAAALIDLAGGSGPTRTQITRTVTTPAAAAPAPVSPTAVPTTTASAPPSTVPGAARPGTTSTTPSTTTGAAPPASRGTSTGSILPGLTQPGTRTPSAPR